MTTDTWAIRRIGEAGRVQAGRQRSPSFTDGKLRPYLRVANVFDGWIDTSDVLEMCFTDEEYERYKLEAGDILLNEGQSLELVGRSAIYLGTPAACCFQNTLIRFRPNQGTDAAFAQLLFQHLRETGQFAKIALQTTSIAHLGVDRFASLRAEFPPLHEQKQIAKTLLPWVKSTSLIQQLIHEKLALKSALMQRLIEGSPRQSGANGLPQPTTLLREVTIEEARRGSSYLGQAAVKAVNKIHGMIPMKARIIGSDLDRYKLVKRDWFAYNPMRINIGSLARWSGDNDVLVSPDYVVFRCDPERLDPDFLDHYRRSPAWDRFVKTAGNGSVRVRIYYDDLGAMRLPLLPLADQKRIAALLNAAGREIGLLRRQLDLVKRQKSALMQQLLSRNLRVKAATP